MFAVDPAVFHTFSSDLMARKLRIEFPGAGITSLITETTATMSSPHQAPKTLKKDRQKD
jgi:hypothetical protein